METRLVAGDLGPKLLLLPLLLAYLGGFLLSIFQSSIPHTFSPACLFVTFVS